MTSRREDILSLIQEGKTVSEVARLQGVSRQRIHQIVKAANIDYHNAKGQHISKPCGNLACQKLIEGSPSFVNSRQFCCPECHSEAVASKKKERKRRPRGSMTLQKYPRKRVKVCVVFR